MRVLVTGANTSVGGALVSALLEARDIEHVCAVGGPRGRALAAHPKLVYRAVDLTHPRIAHDVVWADARDARIDSVVHTCVAGTRGLLAGCIGHPTIRRFVYRSYADVYERVAGSNLVEEDDPIALTAPSPQARERVAADVAVCAHLGGPLSIAVLRCAEVLAPGEQLWEYLHARVCLRALGFDPMINLLSVEDAVEALMCALRSTATGVFNIAGFDTMPLSLAIEASRRVDLPAPVRNRFAGVLDDRRARTELGFVPRHPVTWPQAWWQQLLGRLGAVDAPLP